MMTKMRLDNKWISIMKESIISHQGLISAATAKSIEPIQRGTEPMSKTKPKVISTAKALCLYVFLGTLIGDIIFLLATLYIEFDVRKLSDVNTYKVVALLLLLSYPFAIVIGGIPALISGVLIHISDHLGMKYMRAGLIGFVVSILLYAPFVDGFNTASQCLALLGAAAAIGTRFRINQLENRII